MLGESHNYISQLETAKRECSAAELIAIARKLQRRPGSLLDEIERIVRKDSPGVRLVPRLPAERRQPALRPPAAPSSVGSPSDPGGLPVAQPEQRDTQPTAHSQLAVRKR